MRGQKSINETSFIAFDSKVYLILLTVSLILLFYSIWEIKPLTVEVSDFLGLASHLMAAYWIGLMIVTFCSIHLYLNDVHRSEWIYIISLIILGLFLFGVPVFAEENARFAWSYYPAGEVKTVLKTNYIDTTSEFPLLSYRSWPATHLISASIIYLAGINIETLLKYMPLFWMFSVILISYSIGKCFKLIANQCFLVSLIILSSFWTFHYYYGPQSMAYLIYLLFFMLVAAFSKTARDTVLISLSFVAAVITHMLASIFILSSFIFSSSAVRSIHPKRIRFIIFFLVFFIAWYLYLAPVMFQFGVKEFMTQVTQMDYFSFVKTEKYEAGTFLTRQLIHYSRLFYLGLYAVSMVAAAALYLTGRIKEENRDLAKICFLWLIGILSLFLFKYGEAEIDDRIYIFSLAPMALILVLSFDRKILAALAILFIAFHVFAHYGSESFDMAQTTELRGAEFFSVNVPTDVPATKPYEPYSYFYSTYVLFYDSNKNLVPWHSFTGMHKPNISIMNEAGYIINSRSSYNYMIYAYGFDPVEEWIQLNQDNIDRLYDNGYFRLNKNRGVVKDY